MRHGSHSQAKKQSGGGGGGMDAMFQNPMMAMMANMMGIKKTMFKKGGKSGPKVPPECKVWIGNLPDSVGWKELEEHFNQAGKTKWVEAFKSGAGKGSGGVSYATAEEAQKAISMLNGSILSGQMIQVDTW